MGYAILECGHFASVMAGVFVVQVIEPSTTVAPSVVGHTGSVAPVSYRGTAVHSIVVAVRAVQTTVPSATVVASTKGQSGSDVPVVPGVVHS